MQIRAAGQAVRLTRFGEHRHPGLAGRIPAKLTIVGRRYVRRKEPLSSSAFRLEYMWMRKRLTIAIGDHEGDSNLEHTGEECHAVLEEVVGDLHDS